MNIPDALAAIEHGLTALQQAKAALVTAVPDSTSVVVRAGQNLQAALDKGGVVELEAGAVFEGSYTLNKVALRGKPGTAIRGKTGPALTVTPGSSFVTVSGLELSSGHSEVVALGDNGYGVNAIQTKIEDAPRWIDFANVRVPTHRGKRAYAIHARDVSLINCEVLDCWDPGGQDSQAIYIGNTPGPVTVKGGRYSAGSEIILAGGDTTRIPNVTPADLLFEDLELFRPLSWLTDGVSYKVKNIWELKNARRAILRRSKLSGCWANGQQGEAIVLTPALDGSREEPPLRSGEVEDVLIEDVTITDCSSVANLLGHAYAAYTAVPLSGVVFRRVHATVSRQRFGGRGQLALIQGEPADVAFEDCTFRGDGWTLIVYAPGSCIDPVTKVTRPCGRMGRLRLVNSRVTASENGLTLGPPVPAGAPDPGGWPNAKNWQQCIDVLEVTGNVFGGSMAMLSVLPNNEYLDMAEFDARVPTNNIVWGT